MSITSPSGRSAAYRLPGVALLALVGGGGVYAAHHAERRHHATANVYEGSPALLQIQADSADVEVVPASGGTVRIQWRADWVGKRPAHRVHVRSGVVGLTGSCADALTQFTGLFAFDIPCSVHYRVAVPSGQAIRLAVGSGDVSLRGLHGRIRVTTHSGDSARSEMGGGPAVTLSTRSGDLSASFERAPPVADDATASSGDVSLQRAGRPLPDHGRDELGRPLRRRPHERPGQRAHDRRAHALGRPLDRQVGRMSARAFVTETFAPVWRRAHLRRSALPAAGPPARDRRVRPARRRNGARRRARVVWIGVPILLGAARREPRVRGLRPRARQPAARHRDHRARGAATATGGSISRAGRRRSSASRTTWRSILWLALRFPLSLVAFCRPGRAGERRRRARRSRRSRTRSQTRTPCAGSSARPPRCASPAGARSLLLDRAPDRRPRMGPRRTRPRPARARRAARSSQRLAARTRASRRPRRPRTRAARLGRPFRDGGRAAGERRAARARDRSRRSSTPRSAAIEDAGPRGARTSSTACSRSCATSTAATRGRARPGRRRRARRPHARGGR